MTTSRRTFNRMLLAAPLAAALAQARAQDAAYTVTDFDWTDARRARPVPARLYWPARSGSDAPVPLVVFSHGLGGSRLGYSYLVQHWSSQGVASLHVQHVGSDSALWRGNPFGMAERLRNAAQDSEALARVQDLRFALDQTLAGAAGKAPSALDTARIAVAGHSYGANTALLTIGAQVVRNGATVSYRDKRFGAAVLISAPPFYTEPSPASVLEAVSVPTLHITCVGDVIQLPGYVSGVEDRIAIFDAVADPRKLLAVFRDGSHSIFTDRALTGGSSLNPAVKAATASLSKAFLDSVFRCDGRALSAWQGDWRHIVDRYTEATLSPPGCESRMALAASS
jgi:dienelactone hydrolase